MVKFHHSNTFEKSRNRGSKGKQRSGKVRNNDPRFEIEKNLVISSPAVNKIINRFNNSEKSRYAAAFSGPKLI